MGNTHSSKDNKNVKPAGGADLSILLPGGSLKKDSPQNSAFTFEKKTPQSKLVYQGSHDEQESYMRTVIEEESSKLPRIKTNESTRVNENGEKIIPTVFKWEGGGKNVQISGTFSNWQPLPMVKSHGDFVMIIDLPEGEHEYKFLVDGEWQVNLSEPVQENKLGSKNNKLSVKKTDFEVFEALDVDSQDTTPKRDDEYSQVIPPAKPWEKQPGPPILPPHLLQVILNKDTPLSCEPTLLPQPNHVMLNHLYALSIKDGVMVLSTTHRYRKKYVTTLLYKPI
uniref:5'-AMP-activated protein kinase subunit beta-1 n=1 Tax=Cacopsylla melanoneura TaxID=428564 RepID=A0A8D8RQ46_9HEMI